MGLALAGCAIRLDAEARGNAQRLLSQQRAARKAEAESAAPTERGRNAREFLDVLARSLSARLVHLEAARLLTLRSADLKADCAHSWSGCRCAGGWPEKGWEAPVRRFPRCVGAPGSGRGLSAPLIAAESVQLPVTGEARTARLAEASLAVGRAAQEALANVREHAPGARVSVRLEYGTDGVGLEFGGRGNSGELDESGSQYGCPGCGSARNSSAER
ncbi:hypothetical protein ACWCO0_13755 [Streptomyces tubercidicus]